VAPGDVLEQVLEDAICDTLPRIIISVFDGDAGTLIGACADRKVEGGVRWAMIGALARLTFDGSVGRETTLAFLDRFDRESLAEPGDPAWQGWLDAIYLLGVEEMRAAARSSQEDRFFEYEDELDEWEKRLTLARSLAPGDASLFEKVEYKPINDAVEAVKQFSYREYGDDHEDEYDAEDEHGERRQEKAPFDPARAIAPSRRTRWQENGRHAVFKAALLRSAAAADGADLRATPLSAGRKAASFHCGVWCRPILAS
jgi:hypothetical protein